VGASSAASNVEEVNVGKPAVGIANDGSPPAAAKTSDSSRSASAVSRLVHAVMVSIGVGGLQASSCCHGFDRRRRSPV
jgi:hypothetical protein